MKKRLIFFCSLFGALLLCPSVLASNRMEWGERDASYSEDGLGYNRTASGAAWYYYTIPNNYNGPSEIQVPFNSRFNTKTAIDVNTCKGYGGFWVLMRNEYNRNSGELTGRPAATTAISDIYDPDTVWYDSLSTTQTGWYGADNFVTYKRPGSVSSEETNGIIRATKTDTWENISLLFQKVSGTSAVPKNSSGRAYDWTTTSGLTYFCYSDGVDVSYEDSFHSYSSVAMGDEYNSTPVQDSTSYLARNYTVPMGSEVTLTFHHYLARKEADAPDNIDLTWRVTGTGSTGSGTLVAADISGETLDGLAAKEILKSDGTNFTATVKASSRNGDRQTYCQTITFNPARYRLTSGSNGYDYSAISSEKSSTACVTIVSAESNYIKDGKVLGQTFNCDSGGGATFISSKQVGNTTATVGLLKNNTEFIQTKSSGFDDQISVYAKPGDTVQFFYALCFGAHNVQARTSGYYTRTDSANNAIKNFFTVYNGTKYNKENNNNFLFGRANMFMGQEIMVSNNAARSSSGLKKTSFKSKNTNQNVFPNVSLPDYIYIKKQEIRFASPDTGSKDYDSTARGAYDCFFYSGITNFASSQASSGFQIPGFQIAPAGNCTSAGLAKGSYGQGQVMNSVVGSTINQSLDYTYLAVWRQYLSKYSGSCACDVNTKSYSQKYFTSSVGASSTSGLDNDGIYEDNRNGRADQLMNAFYNAYNYQGYNKIGRYKVPIYEGASTKAYIDGDYSVGLCKTAKSKCNCYCVTVNKKKVCQKCTKYNNNNPTSLQKPYNVYTRDDVTKTASVVIPYNYDTALTAEIKTDNDREVLYAGETVTSEFNVDITPIANPVTSDKNDQGQYIPYATIAPPDTQVQVAEILIRDTDNIEDLTSQIQDNYGYQGRDICNYFWGISAVANCTSEAVKGYDLQNCDQATMKYCEGEDLGNNTSDPDGEEGYYTAGKSTYGSSQFTKLVPDVKAGYKYCTAVGVNYGNSHGGDANGPFKTLSDKSSDANFGANSRSVNRTLDIHVDDGYYWHISAASCRTIAKKPSFQVWNGGIFSSGDITTSITHKYTNAALGDLTRYDATLQNLQKKAYYFGSWEQYYVVAKGQVSGFATASAMGYNGAGMGTVGFGSDTNGFTACDFARLTIANGLDANCRRLDNLGGYYTGSPNSQTALTDDSRVENFVSQIMARYTKSSISRTPQPSSVNAADDSIYENLTISSANSSRYLYINGDFAINDTIIQAYGTRVIHVNGHVSINRNICLGTATQGTCQTSGTDAYKSGYDRNTNNTSLSGRNTADTYSDISQIPQVIIIADSIGIGSDVNQIDAWLITANSENNFYDGGFVNTCDTFTDGVTGSGECWKTLKINGPVVTRGLLLNRTGGAWAGLSGDIGNPAYEYLNSTYANYYQGGTSADSGNAANRDLSCDGSITPAEIFDLHPLVYLWSYYQAQRFTQAITTYSAEYAPRF